VSLESVNDIAKNNEISTSQKPDASEDIGMTENQKVIMDNKEHFSKSFIYKDYSTETQRLGIASMS
jgi:hypothetical protein